MKDQTIVTKQGSETLKWIAKAAIEDSDFERLVFDILPVIETKISSLNGTLTLETD